jgi:hypothetical protein
VIEIRPITESPSLKEEFEIKEKNRQDWWKEMK